MKSNALVVGIGIGLVVLLLVVVAGSFWPRSLKQPENLDVQDPLLREQAFEQCVGEFKEGLAQLSKRYPELQGVETFDHSYVGFVYVNNSVSPRVRIVLAVSDGPLDQIRVEHVGGWEELKDIEVVCALRLETGPNTELKAEVEKLYRDFKAALIEKLNTRSLSRRISLHLRRRTFQRHLEESSGSETIEES